jgi:hypothetical protein
VLTSRAGAAAEIDWQFAPYLWAAAVGLDTTINGDPALGTSVPFKNLVDKLDSAIMLQGEGNDTDSGIGGFVDFISMSLSDTSVTPIGPGGPISGDLTVTTGLSMGLYEAGGILRFGDIDIDKTVMDILLGARYVDIEQDLRITLPGPAATDIDRRIDVSEIDLLVGIRVLGQFTDRFRYKLRGDYADFGTDGTLNLYAGVNYEFGQAGLFSLELGYRHMSIDLSDNLGIGVTSSSDISLSGPVLGFVFSF